MLRRAVVWLSSTAFHSPVNTNVTSIETISITELTDIDLSIDSTIGIENGIIF